MANIASDKTFEFVLNGRSVSAGPSIHTTLLDVLRDHGFNASPTWIAAGRAVPHHVLPETGWVSCWMGGPDDAASVIDLFRLQYERYSSKKST